MADLATLQIKIDAREAIRQSELVGDSLVRVSKAEREAHKEAERLSQVSREMARSMSQAQQSIILADQATRRIAQAERDAYREADKMAQAHRRAAAEMERVRQRGAQLTGVMSGLRNAVGAVVGSLAVREFIRAADSMTLLHGRLKLVTSGAAQLRVVEDALFTSAQRTRVGYEATVQLYARVAANSKELGRSQAELLRFSELIQMATKSSGATSAESGAALIQLSQGLASGQLRGQELMSVMEQLPAVARAIAAGMGITIGEMRKLAAEGEITADAVVSAILKMQTKIEGDFATAPVTAADGWTKFKNALSQWSGAAAEAEGTGRKLNSILNLITTSLEKRTAALQAEARARQGVQQSVRIGPASSFAEEWGWAKPEDPGAAGRARAKAEAEALAARKAAWQAEKKHADEKAGWEYEARMAAEAAIPNAVKLRTELERTGKVLQANAKAAHAWRMEMPTITGIQNGQQVTYRPGQGVMSIPGNIGSGDLRRPGTYTPDKVAEELARNFRENMQRATADIFADFLTSGKMSVRRLFASAGQMGARGFSELASQAMTRNLGADAGVASFGLTFVSTIASAFFKARDAAREMALALEQSARDIEEYARFATDRGMTPEAIEQRRLQDQRDALARQIVGATGVTGFTGGLDEAREFLNSPVSKFMSKDLLDKLREQLDALEDAFAANSEAAKEAAEAAERATAAERVLSLARTVEGLQGFQRDLRRSDLSIYNPFQQQEDAKARYEEILTKASQGDQSAADQLPAAARAWLESSRAINASGSRYVADFKRVELDAASIESRYAAERDVQQQIADGTLDVIQNTIVINETLERTEGWVQQQTTVLQSAENRRYEQTITLIEATRSVERRLRGLEERMAA